MSRFTGGENTASELSGGPGRAGPATLGGQACRRIVVERHAETRLFADLDRALSDQSDHHPDGRGVELRAGVPLEFADRVVRIERLAVQARAGHGLEGV